MTESKYIEKNIMGRMIWERQHGEVTETSPVVIVMHWMTGHATSMDFLFEGMKTPAYLNFLQGEYPSGHPEGGYSWFPLGMDFYDKASEEEQAPLIQESARKIAEVISELKKSHRGKIIVVGMSQGGDLTLNLATYHSHLIDIAIPSAGRLSDPMRPEKTSKQLPIIRMQHGIDDDIVSVESARAVRDWLVSKGFDAKLNEYAGVGHDISLEMRSKIQEIIDNVDSTP